MLQALKKEDFTQFELTKTILNNLSQYDITPTAKLVLLYLTDCYNPKHADVFPKQKTIALKLGISERSVMRAVQELFKAGLILIEYKHTNRYILMPNSASQLSHSDKLSNNKCQNVTFTPDNLSPSYIEQKNKTKKEQKDIKGGNVYSGDDEILKQYAIKHGAKNVQAYVNKLKSTGSARKIIEKDTYRCPHSIEATEQLLKQYREYQKDTVTAEQAGWTLSKVKALSQGRKRGVTM